MQREDWFWLAIKVAGLWLLMEGVRELPVLLDGAFELNPWAQLKKEHVLTSLVPLLAGVLTLMHGHKLVPARATAATDAPAAATGEAAAPPSARAIALLWVACKVLGLYAVTLSLLALPSWLAMGSDGRGLSWRVVGLAVAYAGPVAVFGLWLAFGERLFRLASRDAAKSLP